MSESTVLTPRGSRIVTLDELVTIKAPDATSTWFPLSHAHVVTKVESALAEAGFKIERSMYALSRNDARFFAVLDLASILVRGVNLAVGIRNSHDKSFPIGFCAGSRCLVCDNCCFSGEIIVARKHTRFGDSRFVEALAKAIRSLTQFRDTESARLQLFQRTEITDTQAESLMLRAYEGDILSHRNLPRVIREWRQPSFDEFKARTMWGLMNAFTTVLSERIKGDAQRFARLTIQLSDLLSREAGMPGQSINPIEE